MNIFDTLSNHGVVPVIAIDDAADAIPLADALIAGGLPLAEITFRTDAASAIIKAITNERPDMIVGAGTVLTEAQADAALAAGSQFALSPGIDAAVLAHARKIGLPFAPGVMTPSELQIALRHGCEMVKFFPAMPAGGPAMLKNISAPYAHTGIGFNPTGGVTPDNLADWLSLPQVRAVGGTWIATRDDIAAKNWDKISQNARAAVARVQDIRGA
ncbi:bifunctional 4-hydroxy-2-oxoglutarate aldolase/2-dehydro-3-deoxy-phosphogluconate aldolase [Litoreibacter albidus]|uniref:2-dehydro-3-deoxy-phosphogluconate aldolase n=1 Tax=Litoreibacter albidus TaxID=670155 RepID=A0A1H3CL43_9RHOB|nr:bifunctional 4-hydroxy-2-oxoglutarate aldolase/2-dehydro-3-deoxy-phosphogluconate aldolase [Litoreibacter albidus]SDX54750.1 2-keto-3-deoxy-phosphogluconate aldolase [Litoreibacter albidus]